MRSLPSFALNGLMDLNTAFPEIFSSGEASLMLLADPRWKQIVHSESEVL